VLPQIRGFEQNLSVIRRFGSKNGTFTRIVPEMTIVLRRFLKYYRTLLKTPFFPASQAGIRIVTKVYSKITVGSVIITEDLMAFERPHRM
jgi:hypothetical protein